MLNIQPEFQLPWKLIAVHLENAFQGTVKCLFLGLVASFEHTCMTALMICLYLSHVINNYSRPSPIFLNCKQRKARQDLGARVNGKYR